MTIKRAVFFVLIALSVTGVASTLYAAWYTKAIEQEHPPTGELISIDGIQMHVIRTGDTGEPILLIHGAGANAREFDLSLTPVLAKSHRVLAVDRPGHGYSNRAADAHELGVQAALVAKVFESYADGERAVIVGHSFGSAVALRVALDRPDLVKAIVLLAPVSHDWGPNKVAWYFEYGSSPWSRTAFSQLMPIFGPSQARPGMANSFAPAPAPDGFYDSAGVGLMFRPANFRADSRDRTALREELVGQQSRYGELRIPVRVFFGAGDESYDPSLHTEQLSRDVTDIEIVALENEGHQPHVRETDVIASAIAQLATAP